MKKDILVEFNEFGVKIHKDLETINSLKNRDNCILNPDLTHLRGISPSFWKLTSDKKIIQNDSKEIFKIHENSNKIKHINNTQQVDFNKIENKIKYLENLIQESFEIVNKENIILNKKLNNILLTEIDYKKTLDEKNSNTFNIIQNDLIKILQKNKIYDKYLNKTEIFINKDLKSKNNQKIINIILVILTIFSLSLHFWI